MTLEQLEKRQLADLRNRLDSTRGPTSVDQTFGFIGDDPEFDEIVRLGREYRRHANDES
jgi:hypothetical protein